MKIYQHQIQLKGHISWDGIFIRVPTNLLSTALVSLLQIRKHFLVHMVPKQKLSLFILESSLLDLIVTYHLLYHQRTSFTLEKQKTANTEEKCSFLFLEMKTIGSKIMSNPFILTNDITSIVTRFEGKITSSKQTASKNKFSSVAVSLFINEINARIAATIPLRLKDTFIRQSIQTEHSDRAFRQGIPTNNKQCI
ncbi:hypothetical protein H6P81_016342 [Aristolochia fimbriata]|uniref:Uncharacterized protein n=1 Tax=Aristolochia fimbriata TaxID=158543 RepID=A0AAV7EBT7_ARIFI|nr:hypothetical protein H6P81_016342 [Aristolochia fimbriata]